MLDATVRTSAESQTIKCGEGGYRGLALPLGCSGRRIVGGTQVPNSLDLRGSLCGRALVAISTFPLG